MNMNREQRKALTAAILQAGEDLTEANIVKVQQLGGSAGWVSWLRFLKTNKLGSAR